MTAISLREQLAKIGEAIPFAYPGDFQTAPPSLIAALLSMNCPQVENWRFLFKREFANTDWSEEFQGLSHDQQYWYFSRRGGILKFDKQYRKINQVGIPQQFRQQQYNHFGDCDHYQGHIYVPLEHESFIDPAIVVFDSNLTLAWSGKLATSGQRHAPWCAIHPWNGHVYTSEDDQVSSLYVYERQTLNFLGQFQLYDAHGRIETLSSIQGGCFSSNGHLYLTSGNTHDIRCYNMLNNRLMGRTPVTHAPGFPEYEEIL